MYPFDSRSESGTISHAQTDTRWAITRKGYSMSTTMLKDNATNKRFDYGFAKVRELSVASHKTELSGSQKGKFRTVVDSVTINGEELRPSKRFWTSIQCRFGFSANVFRYFDHKEVFDRISERAPDDKIRFCIERDPDKNTNILLAATNPGASTVRFNQLAEILNKYNAEGTTYSNGIVRSTHKPRAGGGGFKVAGDDFMNQFVIDTPIDGFGKPNIYLSLLRMICTNGMVGYSKAFRSELGLGKNDEDVSFALSRAMEGFNNEEGFAALRSRFDTAAKSWASVNEAQKLYAILMARANRGELAKRGIEHTSDGVRVETSMPIFQGLGKMTGDISQIYGLSNLESLPVKRQRTLPVACTVYDLLNYATEVATHHSNTSGDRALQAYVGDLISTEYDLENTVDQYSDYRDFFVSDENTAATLAAMQEKGK